MSSMAFDAVDVARRILALFDPETGCLLEDAYSPEGSPISQTSDAPILELPEPSIPPLDQPLEIHDPLPTKNTDMSCLEISRTESDRSNFKNWAIQKLFWDKDADLEEHEVAGGPARKFPDVCGVFVDTTSAKGMAVISCDGYPVRQVTTGSRDAGDSYVEMSISKGESCRVYGDARVLYFSRPGMVDQETTQTVQTPPAPTIVQTKIPSPILQPPDVLPGVRLPGFQDFVAGVLPESEIPPVITVRFQKDGQCRFGKAYDFLYCIWPKMKSTDFFFRWKKYTGRGGSQGPSALLLSLPHAMPHPRQIALARHLEDDFRYAKKTIPKEFEKAKLLNKNLREFVVYVTEPGWGSKAG